MDTIKALTTITVDLNQKTLQDLFDLEDGMDQIVESLIDVDDIPNDVWYALEMMRNRIDALRERAIVLPTYINHISPVYRPPKNKITSTS